MVYKHWNHSYNLSISWYLHGLCFICLVYYIYIVFIIDCIWHWQSEEIQQNHIHLWLCFYQTRSAWSMDQGSTRKRFAVHNLATIVTKLCAMWEGLSLPHDTKFGNCRGGIVDRRMIFIWSLIHGWGWSGLIKAEPIMISIFSYS